jgi:hypothetical protein
MLVSASVVLTSCARRTTAIPADPSFAFADVRLYETEDAFTRRPVSREVFGARIVKEYQDYLFEGDTLTLQYVQERREPQLVEIAYLYLPDNRDAFLTSRDVVIDAVDAAVSSSWGVSFLPPPVDSVERTQEHRSYVDDAITYCLDIPVDSLGSHPAARFYVEVHAYDRRILERYQ